MVIRIDGSRDVALETLQAVVESVGWSWLPRDEQLVSLVPEGLAAGPEAGWLLSGAELDGATEVTIWLPDDGRPGPRERLESAFEELTGARAETGLLRRLRRIEGQVRGLQRMIDTGRDCDAVLTQWSAVSMALKQAAAHLVADHLVDCVRTELAKGGDPTQVNRRLMNVLF